MVYTRGELNKLVDAFLHPLVKQDPCFILLDGIFHAIIEENPSESIVKFLRYDAPLMLKETAGPNTRKKARLE